jgi:hypothetical protein
MLSDIGLGDVDRLDNEVLNISVHGMLDKGRDAEHTHDAHCTVPHPIPLEMSWTTNKIC